MGDVILYIAGTVLVLFGTFLLLTVVASLGAGLAALVRLVGYRVYSSRTEIQDATVPAASLTLAVFLLAYFFPFQLQTWQLGAFAFIAGFAALFVNHLREKAQRFHTDPATPVQQIDTAAPDFVERAPISVDPTFTHREIFISYSSADSGIASSICSALERQGFSCWIASRDVQPGENFQESVVRAIRAAKVMVLVFSSNANTSEEIKKELVLASQNKVTVIPARVEDVLPNDAFAYEFATRQWIDLFDDWERQTQRLGKWIASVIQPHRMGKAQ